MDDLFLLGLGIPDYPVAAQKAYGAGYHGVQGSGEDGEGYCQKGKQRVEPQPHPGRDLYVRVGDRVPSDDEDHQGYKHEDQLAADEAGHGDGSACSRIVSALVQVVYLERLSARTHGGYVVVVAAQHSHAQASAYVLLSGGVVDQAAELEPLGEHHEGEAEQGGKQVAPVYLKVGESCGVAGEELPVDHIAYNRDVEDNEEYGADLIAGALFLFHTVTNLMDKQK